MPTNPVTSIPTIFPIIFPASIPDYRIMIPVSTAMAAASVTSGTIAA